MATYDDVPFKDLETKGFVHIPGFLAQDELAACRADFEAQPLSKNRNYGVSLVSDQAVARLKDRVETVMARVRTRTNLQVDCTLGGGYFATGRGISFPWHQDYESFFSSQNHYDYLNFYIPVVKPQRNKSNLTVIPFDVLQRESPETFQRVVRGGATRFVVVGDKQIAVAEDAGTTHVVPVDIERLAHTPLLDAGDLLLMRGDVIHRTQDTDTERVSLSLRVASSKTVIRRSMLADGPLAKARAMVNNPPMYEPIFRAFEDTGKNEIEIGELMTWWAAKAATLKPSDAKGFYRYLLMQKVRTGVVFSSLKKTVSSTLAVRLYQLSHRQPSH
jgi:hypothetical protein